MRWAWTAIAIVVGCGWNVEGTNVEGPATSSGGPIQMTLDGGETTLHVSGGTGEAQQCGEIHSSAECTDAGCVPLEVTPFDTSGDQTCASEAPIVMCSPIDELHGCADALRCDDGRYAWALVLPDGGALLANVKASCGLPRGFQPCPVAATNGLVAAATTGTSGDSTSGSDDDPLAEACACAC